MRPAASNRSGVSAARVLGPARLPPRVIGRGQTFCGGSSISGHNLMVMYLWFQQLMPVLAIVVVEGVVPLVGAAPGCYGGGGSGDVLRRCSFIHQGSPTLLKYFGCI